MQAADLKVPAAGTPILKTTYEITSSIRNLYTGGKIVISSNGQFLFCLCDGSAHMVALASGKMIKKFSEVFSYTALKFVNFLRYQLLRMAQKLFRIVFLPMHLLWFRLHELHCFASLMLILEKRDE
jgi:hypothetical protein